MIISYAKTIEDGNKGTNFTGIVFGASSSYINPYDESTEGKIGIVANGVTTVIATARRFNNEEVMHIILNLVQSKNVLMKLTQTE